MESTVLFSVQMLLFLGIATATVHRTVRPVVGAGLVAIAGGCLIAASLQGTAERTLEISHQFTAYVDLAVRAKDFPVETVRAPGYHWAAVCAAFALIWGGWLIWRRETPRAAGALGEPLVFAWSGALLQLALEKLAAPAILVAPFDLAPDRALFPATLAGAFLLARAGRKIVHLVLYLSLFIAVTRLPLALFGTLATRGEWGTHLDVHGTRYIVPPGGGTTTGEIALSAGGSEQLFWLIWAPHLIVYPAFYMMSTGGFAFLRLMWQAHLEESRSPQ